MQDDELIKLVMGALIAASAAVSVFFFAYVGASFQASFKGGLLTVGLVVFLGFILFALSRSQIFLGVSLPIVLFAVFAWPIWHSVLESAAVIKVNGDRWGGNTFALEIPMPWYATGKTFWFGEIFLVGLLIWRFMRWLSGPR